MDYTLSPQMGGRDVWGTPVAQNLPDNLQVLLPLAGTETLILTQLYLSHHTVSANIPSSRILRIK